ncbi:phage tail protein [Acidomonas methanolica]|uniref:phage tail protein n=1 Tax=Acidomonas methanolica TaxID=437 RepID=UPI00211A1225|nr:phage tail protein [Acidomonas methanolica]MCQ9154068.1 phage tail protein [Acidomonas methanolica]
MSAVGHVMGADLSLSGGGLAVVDGAEEVRQRLLRRLCTNPGGYIWQIGYGAGLPAMIGSPVVSGTIKSVVLAQMALESGVDQTQPVDVSVSSSAGGVVSCAITYVDAATQEMQTLLLDG